MRHGKLALGVATAFVLLAIGFTQLASGYAGQVVGRIRSRFANGHTELQRSFQAKRNAKSFRMKTVLRMHPGHALETLTEVSCPNRERMTTTIGEKSFHAVRIGSEAFVEQQDGQWTKQVTPSTSWSPCGDNPGEPTPWATMNEGRDLLTILAKIAGTAFISRDHYVITETGSCQEWIISMDHPGGARSRAGTGIRYTICIDPNQHWPVRIVMGSGAMVVTYYDWNQPIEIDAPSSWEAGNTYSRNGG